MLRVFGGKLRVRVCGIAVDGDRLLLVNLRNVTHGGDLWCPPGGGMAFGESATETLRREFLEETGLEVEPGELLFVNEFIGNGLHAVELFFQVRVTGGVLRRGHDPELQTQVLADIGYFTFAEMRRHRPDELHNLFRHCDSVPELLALRGYLKPHPGPPQGEGEKKAF